MERVIQSELMVTIRLLEMSVINIYWATLFSLCDAGGCDGAITIADYIL